MIPAAHHVVAALFGYLLGALPFGYLVARAHGVDIFKVGSGNPGATNVKRVLGPKAGNTVFALDAGKGAAAAFWGLGAFTGTTMTYDLSDWGINATGAVAGEGWRVMALIGLISAVLGHSFSVFTRFKGGKGVATAAGGLVMLAPLACLASVVVWVATFLITRYVSLGSILASVAAPVVCWIQPNLLVVKVTVTVLGLFVIYRHRENIARLRAGTENRFTRKPAA